MKKEILNFALDRKNEQRRLVSFQNLDSFPEPVQRFLQLVLEEETEVIYYSKMIHGGFFKTDPERPWFKIKGHYHYLTDIPAFYWKGIVRPLPILSISARDYYFKGKGEVKIKLNSVMPMGKSIGPEIDQAALLRFLSELAMIPTAFLTADYLTWEEINSTSARVFIEDCGIKADGVFRFNEKGEMISFESKRARAIKKGISFDKWGGYYKDYKKFGDYLVPTKFVGTWYLPDGDFDYIKFKVENMEFNTP